MWRSNIGDGKGDSNSTVTGDSDRYDIKDFSHYKQDSNCQLQQLISGATDATTAACGLQHSERWQ